MAIAQIDGQTYTHNLTAVATQAYTVGAGATLLLVGLSYIPNAESSTGMTYNGVTMQQWSTASSGTGANDRNLAVYYLINPPSGAHNIVSTLTGARTQNLLVSTWSGTSASAPLGTAVTAAGATGVASSVATGSAYPFLSFVFIRSDEATNGAVATSPATRLLHLFSGTSQRTGMSSQSSGASAAWTWSGGTLGSQAYCEIGVQLIAASSLPAGTTVKVRQSGVFVDGTLRVRHNNAWVTPVAITPLGYATVTGVLPWDLPNETTITLPTPAGGTETAKVPWGATTKLVAAHYVPWFPIRINNVANGPSEYYEGRWVTPGSIEGGYDNRLWGGYLRDRPPNRPVLSGDWQLADMVTEVTRALDARIDAFFIDATSSSSTSTNNQNLQRLFDAADQVYANTGRLLRLVPMLDGNGSVTAYGAVSGHISDLTAAGNAAADYVATFRNRRSILRTGGDGTAANPGTITLPVFGPEGWPSNINNADSDRLAFWTAFKNRLTGYWATPVRLVFCYVAAWDSTTVAGRYNGIVYAHSRWGDRATNSVNASNTQNALAPATCHAAPYSKPWMHWVSPGDSRPQDGKTRAAYRVWEQTGTLAFERTWDVCISGADLVQMTTWNDYAEHAHVAPSTAHDWCWLDLNTWWMTKYKTGAYPAIVRDGLYLAMRTMPHSTTTVTGTQTVFGANESSGTPLVNIVEVRAFLRTAATVQLLVDGSVTQTASGVAGANRWEWALPASGVVSARAQRSATTVPGTVVTSAIDLGGPYVADNYFYQVYSSLRQAAGA